MLCLIKRTVITYEGFAETFKECVFMSLYIYIFIYNIHIYIIFKILRKNREN